MRRAAVKWGQIIFFVLVVGVVALLTFLSRTSDPFKGQGPDLTGYLSEEKTLCENKVQALKAKGIDGEPEYEKAQAAASDCIGYLQGVVDQGGGDKDAIKDRLMRLKTASEDFRGWAAQKVTGAYGDVEENVDLPGLATAALKLLDVQEQQRRKAVKESLEKCKFHSWNEVNTGALP